MFVRLPMPFVDEVLSNEALRSKTAICQAWIERFSPAAARIRCLRIILAKSGNWLRVVVASS